MDIKVLASGSSGNAYRISDGKTALLLDAGIPLKGIQVGLSFRVRELAGCFITHAHQDHSKAAKDLARLGIDIYTSRGTIEACGLTGHRIKPAKALEELTVGTFKVLPFDVQHDAPEPLGFLYTSTTTGEKLLYFTGLRSPGSGSSGAFPAFPSPLTASLALSLFWRALALTSDLFLTHPARQPSCLLSNGLSSGQRQGTRKAKSCPAGSG